MNERIRREAKVAGLRGLDGPTLEAVESRRLQLWIVMSVVLVSVSAAMVAVSLWSDGTDQGLLAVPPGLARLGIVGLVGGFCAYGIEKEMHLRRLTRLLVDERVLVGALSHRLGELSSLLGAGQAMNSVLDLQDVLDRILDNALDLLKADDGSVLLFDGVARLNVVCARGTERRDEVVAVGTGLPGRVAASRTPQLVEAADGVRSAMSTPLVHRDELLGVLDVVAADGRSFGDYDLQALSVFAEHAAGAIANARLYEAERAHAQALEHQAFHDPLTGLPNRKLFADRLGHALRRNGHNGLVAGVLFLDLDDFKRVNDSLGHATGDQVLCAVAERLQRSLRDADTPARLAGDEFAVLLEDLEDDDHAVATAERIVAAVAVPFQLGDREVAVKASVGVATARAGDVDTEDLLRNADVAMYIAKAQGKGGLALYEPTMHATVLERIDLEADLERAVERAELVLHYQPVVELATGRLTGFEGLVRWQHPKRGLILPDNFVPLAEETGLIVGIDRWVLLHACCQGKQWQEQYPSDTPLTVGVNLSTRQLETDAVVDMVSIALEVSGLKPEHLVLEVTESFVLADEEASARRMHALRALGVRLAIDDFGTGYASLSYLKRLPVDILKIDKSFTEGLGRTAEDAALVQAIVKLARSLELEIVAEGVERADQLQALIELKCHYGQGWHFSKALTATEMDEALNSARGAADRVPIAGR